MSWEHGVDESEEEDELQPGSAKSIHNWIPEAPGILRVRRAWLGVTGLKAQSPTAYWLDLDGSTHVNTVWPPPLWKAKSFYFASNVGDNHDSWWLGSFNNDADLNSPALTQQIWAIKTGTIFSNTAGFYGSLTGGGSVSAGGPAIPGAGGGVSGASGLADPGGMIQTAGAASVGNGWWPVYGWGNDSDPNLNFDLYPVAFAKGITQILFTHPYFGATFRWGGETPAHAVILDPGRSQSPSYSGDKAHAGRAIAFHKNRFFIGGDDAETGVPWNLYYSQVNNSGGWKQGSNYLFEQIGPDDGTAIEDLVGWNQSLYIGKAFRVYVLNGGGPSNFDVIPLDGMNCGQGRTLVPTPQGLIVCGDRDVWLYDGSNPQVISHPILDDYAQGADDWRQACYTDGTLYIAQHAAPNKILAFDLARGVWHTEDVSYNGGVVTAFAVNKRMATGPFADDKNPMAIRDFPDSARLRDDFADAGSVPISEPFSAEARRMFVSETGPITIRNIYIRTRQRAGRTGRLKVTFIFDGTDDPYPRYIDASPSSPDVKVTRLDHGKTCRSFGIRVESGADSATTALWDVNAVGVIYDPLPSR